MGMIRVSDEVERGLKQIADGRSMNAVVARLLGEREAEGIKAAVGGNLVTKEYFDKRFDELKSLIEDTTVDRVNSGGPKNYVSGSVKVYVPWDVARELFFEFLPEDAPEYIGSVSETIQQTDDEFPVFIQDDKLWTEDFYGAKSPILNISPRVTQFLKEANVAEH